VTIRVDSATAADVEALADLMAELETYYGTPPTQAREDRVARIKRLVFGEPPAANILVARDDRHLVGMAAYNYLWPAVGITHSLYLKELYIREGYRRQGIGRLLMDALRAIAADQGCSRVEWTAQRDDEGAQAFYAALGAPVHQGKVFYRVAISEQCR
jgi:GNAT superfamily N-acetyltransferase